MTLGNVRRLIIIGGITGGLIILVTLFLFGKKTGPRSKVTPTPTRGFPTSTPLRRITRTPRYTITPTRRVATATPTIKPTATMTIVPRISETHPDFTGAGDDSLSAEEAAVAKQSYDLRTRLPITTDTFTISFDYVSYTFIAAAKGNQETAKQQLAAWLKANGYTVLSVDMFIFR